MKCKKLIFIEDIRTIEDYVKEYIKSIKEIEM